ncbi:hypothetical protein GKC56_00150 [Neisseriaceae bacterium PsAf]|nr:hypothetical protein [Neisseriaceae bacterium PsAf]
MNITKQHRVLRQLVMCSFLLATTACVTSPYEINKDYQAVSMNERIRHIIVHYTSETEEKSLQILSKGELSAHYLIGKAKKAGDKPTIYISISPRR